MEVNMDDWEFDDEWDLEDEWFWDDEEVHEDFVDHWTHLLASAFFLSDNEYLPSAGEDYSLGYLDARDWWPLVQQLDEMVDLEGLVEQVSTLDALLRLDGLPTELLEAPLEFLETVLEGNLPKEPSGRRVGSRRLVKIALAVVQLVQDFPDAAQAAVRAWANVHRQLVAPDLYDDFDYDEPDLADLLFHPDLPPAMTGFSLMIALTLMRWPERAEGLPLPPGFDDPSLYGEVLAQWEELPDSVTITGEGSGEAEALFAQGQLAHMLAQMGAVELLSADEIEEADMALAYSRLSRAILWVHNQCRHCPERDEAMCKAADNWPERPVPLLDVASEIANTSRIGGCVKM
jgi:hypothetical protein